MRSSRVCTDGSLGAADAWVCVGEDGGGADCASNALVVSENKSNRSQREPINRLLKLKRVLAPVVFHSQSKKGLRNFSRLV